MASMADRLLTAMAGAAARQYGGEAVSELEHALQCAELAEAAGADPDLVLAALLHDVGRYAVPQSLVLDRLVLEGAEAPSRPPRSRGVPHASTTAPRGHHEVGADLIAPWVPARVAWCVHMHADAKRYLCATESGYYDRLSPVPRQTLVMQGGVMTAQEVAAVEGHPWLPDALALRRWDDAAKVPGAATRPLAWWAPRLRTYFAPARRIRDCAPARSPARRGAGPARSSRGR
jgi:gamma-butyrobetaine dioxygenase